MRILAAFILVSLTCAAADNGKLKLEVDPGALEFLSTASMSGRRLISRLVRPTRSRPANTKSSWKIHGIRRL
jgi:hypothetical protein